MFPFVGKGFFEPSGRWLSVMRQGGRRLSLPSNPLPSSALLRSKSTLGDVVLPKEGNHGPQTHLAGSAATTSLGGAAFVTCVDAVVHDLQGRHPDAACRASFNVRRAPSSSTLLDTLPYRLCPTTPRRPPAETRRAMTSSDPLDAPPHGLRSSCSTHRGIVPLEHVGLRQRACSGEEPPGVALQ